MLYWHTELGINRRMPKYFTMQQFKCKCGCQQNDISPVLVYRLDTARSTAGIPFIITSGYRCRKHNKNVGGVIDSQHCNGNAVDIVWKDYHSLYLIINALLLAGFNRIGINYQKKFIHCDVSETKTHNIIWKY